MKLNYRIVWVDDTPAWVDSVLDDVKEYLVECGYEPTIEILENGKELQEKCSNADLDLVIIDYNLPGENGDILISKLRDAGSFTETVFYSHQWPAKEATQQLDGVYRCQRESAVDKIKKIIDLTLHKLKDIGVVRGLVISAAIDLEVKIEELMELEFGEKGSLFRERVLDERFLDCAKKAAFLLGVVKKRVSDCEPGNTHDRLEGARTTLNAFVKEIVDQRNILAHSRPTKKDGQIVLEGINKRTRKISFDAQWINDMRANLRKHQENLDVLEKLLKETE